MTPCERYKQSILDAVDQEGPSSLNYEIQEHLDQCKTCARFYESLVLLKKGLSKLKPVKAPDSFQIVLQERIRREMANKPGIRFEDRKNWFPGPLAAVAAVMIVVGSVYVGQIMIHRQDAREAQLSGTMQNGSVDRVSYVIDDIDLSQAHGSGMRMSRIDSLLQKKPISSVRAHIQPVSF